MSDVLSAGYVLVVAEVRRGLFEERNLDTIGLGRQLGLPVFLLLPDNVSGVDESLLDRVLKVSTDEGNFLNPLTTVSILAKVFESQRAAGLYTLYPFFIGGRVCRIRRRPFLLAAHYRCERL